MARMMAQHDTNGTMVRMVRWRAWRTGWTGLGWMDGMDGLHGWAGWMDGWAGWAGLTCRAVDTANVGWMDGWGLGVQATSVSDSNPEHTIVDATSSSSTNLEHTIVGQMEPEQTFALFRSIIEPLIDSLLGAAVDSGPLAHNYLDAVGGRFFELRNFQHEEHIRLAHARGRPLAPARARSRALARHDRIEHLTLDQELLHFKHTNTGGRHRKRARALTRHDLIQHFTLDHELQNFKHTNTGGGSYTCKATAMFHWPWP